MQSRWELHAYAAYKTAQELFGHCGCQIKVGTASEPIAGGEAVYTQRESQSQEGRQYIPSVRTNRRRGGSILYCIYEYTQRENQSQEARRYIPSVKTNRRSTSGAAGSTSRRDTESLSACHERPRVFKTHRRDQRFCRHTSAVWTGVLINRLRATFGGFNKQPNFTRAVKKNIGSSGR
eukprot:1180561-Prorocentrum_minimum.AAC.1